MHWEVRIERAITYQDLETLQTTLTQTVLQNPEKAFLLFSEPTPTYTCGRAGGETDLLWTSEQIQEQGIETFHVSRGGKWTFHGPGQLLLYPILHLPSWGYSTKEVQRFMDDFRKGVLTYLQSLELPVEAGENPFGIYCGPKKLVSFGFRFTRAIANHGLALYIAPQQFSFRGINPCGVTEQALTSLNELGLPITWNEVAHHLGDFIKKGFTLPKN